MLVLLWDLSGVRLKLLDKGRKARTHIAGRKARTHIVGKQGVYYAP